MNHTCGGCLHWLDYTPADGQCALLLHSRRIDDDAGECGNFAELAPRRCFDGHCRVRADCPLYARRHDREQGAGASTWRHGWEHQDGPCAVARAEREAGRGELPASATTEDDA